MKIPYCNKDRNKALYMKQRKASNGSKSLILKKIPHVPVTLLKFTKIVFPTYKVYYKRNPKNLIYFTIKIFFPI